MNNRFNRIGLKSKPPFTSASIDDACPVVCIPPEIRHEGDESSSSSGSGSIESDDNSVHLEGVRALTLSVSAPEGELNKGLQIAWSEIRRAQIYGFCEKELELVRKAWLSQLQTSWLEKDQEESSYLSECMKLNFLTLSSISSPSFDIPLEVTLLKSIKVEELQPCLVVRK